MLNENTLKGLKVTSSVGNAGIVRYPWTTVLQSNKSLIAFINLEDYGEEQFEEFGLESISEFLTLVDFFDSPEITKEGNVITIKSDKFTQHYGVSDVDIMKAYDVKSSSLEKIENTPEIINFEISGETLKQLKKIGNVTKATSFIIDPENESIVVGKMDRNFHTFNDTTMKHNINSNKNIKIIFEMANIAKLPEMDYSVSVKQSEKTGNCISMWDMVDEPIKIVVAIKETLGG